MAELGWDSVRLGTGGVLTGAAARSGLGAVRCRDASMVQGQDSTSARTGSELGREQGAYQGEGQHGAWTMTGASVVQLGLGAGISEENESRMGVGARGTSAALAQGGAETVGWRRGHRETLTATPSSSRPLCFLCKIISSLVCIVVMSNCAHEL